MASRSAGDTSPLAARAWQRLFDFFISTRAHRDETLERFGLTPNDARALHTLEASAGKPMRALAEAWGTDASNATWVVDRLERLGLAERRADAADRRVKLVTLTARGVSSRDEIMRAFHQPPPELVALERRDLVALDAILAKLTPGESEQSSSPYSANVATRRAGPRPARRRRQPRRSSSG